jgi:hypothetical protein
MLHRKSSNTPREKYKTSGDKWLDFEDFVEAGHDLVGDSASDTPAP